MSVLPPARADWKGESDWRDGLATPAQELSAKKAERHAFSVTEDQVHEIDDTAKAYRQGRGRATQGGNTGGLLWLAVNAPEEKPAFLPVLAGSPPPSATARRISFAEQPEVEPVPGLEPSTAYPRSSSSDDYEEDDASLERMASSFSSASMFPVGDALDSPALPTSPIHSKRRSSFLTIRDLDDVTPGASEEEEAEDPLSLSQHELMLSELRKMKTEEMEARLSGRFKRKGDDPFAELRNAVQDMHEDSQGKAEEEIQEFDFMSDMLQRLNDGYW